MATINIDAILGEEPSAVMQTTSQVQAPQSNDDFLNEVWQGQRPGTPGLAAPATSTSPVVISIDNRSSFEVGTDAGMRGIKQIESNIYSAFGAFDKAQEIEADIAANYAPANPDITADNASIAGFAGEAIASNVPNLAAGVALASIPVVGWGLAGAYFFTQLYGESRKNILDETGTDNPLAAIGPASINTLMEMNPVLKVANKLGLGSAAKKSIADVAKEASEKGVLTRTKDALKFAGEIGVKEGAIEVAQQMSNLATVRVLQNEAIIQSLDKQEVNEAINNFAGGMFGGAVLGGAAQTYADISVDKKAVKQVEEIERQIQFHDDLINKVVAMKEQATPSNRIAEGLAAATIKPDTSTTTPSQAQPTTSSDPITAMQDNADIADKEKAPAQSLKQEALDINTPIAETVVALPQEQQDVFLNGLRQQRYALEQRLNFIDKTLTSIGESATPLTGGSMIPLVEEQNLQVLTGELQAPALLNLANPDMKQYVRDPDGVVTSKSPTLGVSGTSVVSSVDLNQSFVGGHSTFFDIVDQFNSIVKDLGMDINPTTKSPMKFVIEVNNEKDSQAAVQDTNTYVMRLGTNGAMTMQNATETLLHELGHLMKINILASAPKEVYQAINASWQDRLMSVKYRDAFVNQNKPTDRRKVPHSKINARDFNSEIYDTSLPEYAAEQFYRALVNKVGKGDFNMRKQAPSMFANFLKRFRRLFAQSKSMQSKFAPTNYKQETFDRFVERMTLTRQIAELKAKEQQATYDKKAAAEVMGETRTADLPKSDLEKVSLFMRKMGVSEENADRFDEMVNLNMGFLGEGTLGASMKGVMTPIQIAEQADKRGFNLPYQYMEIVQAFQQTKMKIVEAADTVMKSWQSESQHARDVSRMLFVASTASDQKGRRLTAEELEVIKNDLKISDLAFASWQQTDESLRLVLDPMEATSIYEVARANIPNRAKAKEFRDRYMEATSEGERMDLVEEYTGESAINLDPDSKDVFSEFYKDLQKTTKRFTDMRDRNYFPRSRLGQFYVRVIATEDETTWENYTANEGETVGFYSFDTEKEQKEFLESVKNETATSGGVRFYGSKMASSIYSTMGMPNVIVEKVRKELEAEGTLSVEDKRVLKDLALELSPGKKFLKHMTRRKGIAGYNEDAARVYANYMASASNHIARAEHASDMADALQRMEDFPKQYSANYNKTLANGIQSITEYYKRHFKYVMAPDNDFANLRAAGFLWYLGFNIKSAAVNFMQTPLVLYPVLAGYTSDAHAMRRIGGALQDVFKAVKKPDTLEPDLLVTIDEMIKAGLIDESMVSDLAAMGEETGLRRLVPGYDLQSSYQKFSYYAGSMFRYGEKFNRMVATIASHRIAKDRGLTDQDEITKFVRDVIQSSQFEYSRFNRAEFMRGKKSVIFLFWQYMQHASYLFFGGKGGKTALRMWILAGVIAGLEGLPFAELLLGLLDLGGTKVKAIFGSQDPRVDIRKEIREILVEMEVNPDLILRGTSHSYGMFAFHMLPFLGVPFPNVNTRGSLGYGDPIPWFDGLTDPTVTDVEKAVYKTVAGVAGPIGGITLTGVQAMMSNEPDQWKRWEAAAPTFIRNASAGTRWLARGEEVTRQQAKLVGFETPEERISAVLKAMGFQATALDTQREQMRAVQVAAMYYESRRSALLDRVSYAYATNNREAIRDAMDDVTDFNKELLKTPSLAPLTISGKTLNKSISGKLEVKAEIEANILQGENMYLLQKDIQKLYPTGQ